MANPAAPPSQTPLPPRRSKLVRCIALILLALIVLVGLVVLITWLVVKPKRIVYTVEAASVSGFNLTHDHLSADFDFMLRSVNPNRKVSIYYDSMEVMVSYYDNILAFAEVQPFYQPRQNVTQLEVKPVAKSAALMESASRDLRLEKSSGGVELDIRVKARIRLKMGAWKSRRRTLKVFCPHVLVHFSSAKKFQRARCDVDL
ncbi:hypothetical protein L1049_014002 [Liquidambar formosana]|uniref:Late embryogenesis abundant protein LEA-2 subgroup domain-containing protein n=1 Tax=Liquidambar formosana TaxID=63359 RepID=A0AAP0WUJ7_LIQFO